MYIDASGARKSVIMSHKVMGRAGHFGKVLTELSRTLSLSTTVTDCGSTHLVPYILRNKKYLEKLDGKFYSMDPKGESGVKVLNASSDEDLVGQTIYCRSACTCALDDPNKVCPRCFGMTAILNMDIANGIGAFVAEEVAKRIEQDILSTKHLLTTDSQKIKFNDEFYKFFSMDADEVTPNIQEELNDAPFLAGHSTQSGTCMEHRPPLCGAGV